MEDETVLSQATGQPAPMPWPFSLLLVDSEEEGARIQAQ